MYRTIQDFQNMWQFETDATLKCFRNLTDESLAFRSPAFPRSLGRLAQHIAESPNTFFTNATGVVVAGPAFGQTPVSVQAIRDDYEKSTDAVLEEVNKWSDANLEDQILFFGMPMTKGILLATLITHQAHHRGQLTVLMHEAGVPASGFYGPTAIEHRAQGEQPLP